MLIIEKTIGTEGDDTLTGVGLGDRHPPGTEIVHKIFAGAGDDTLIAGPHATFMHGGEGADLFVVDADSPIVRIKDLDPDVDRIDLSDWGIVEFRQLFTIGGLDFDIVIGFENHRLSLDLSALSLNLFELGPDVFIFADPTPLPQTVTLEPGQERFIAPTGGPIDIIGNDTRNVISGNGDDNTIDGGGGNDVLIGAAGDDALIDGPGRDELVGGDGRDTFVLVADGTRDRIIDFDIGIDTLDISAWGVTSMSQLTFGPAILADATITGGRELLVISFVGSGIGAVQAFQDFGFVRFSPRAEVQGTDASERLLGSRAGDILIDGAGSDDLFGLAGKDTFVLVADGEADTIKDFNRFQDDIDLSAWGVAGFEQLAIDAHGSGKAFIRFEGELLIVRSETGEDLAPVLSEDHFLFA